MNFFLFLQKLTATNIRDVMMKYVYDVCPVIAAVGPVETLPDYNILRAGMYWLRV